MPATLLQRRATRLACLLLLLTAAFVAINTRTQAAPAAGPTTTCSGEQFTDVCPGDWFYPFVTDLSNITIISGYSDGTFRPNNTITRAQVMKVIVLAMDPPPTLPAAPSFVDVNARHPFYAFIEAGAANGLTTGYTCGGTGEPCPGLYFHPNADV